MKKGRTWRKRNKMKSYECHCQGAIQSEEKELRMWMRRNGMRKTALKLWNFPLTGRGLMATRKIKAGEVIVSIPHGSLITADTVLHSEIGPFIKQAKPKLSLQQALALFLLMERQKGENSLWLHYMNTIPADFTTPGYFPQPCPLMPDRLKVHTELHITKLRKAFKQVRNFCERNLCDTLKTLSFELFRWAWYAVNSRSVFYKTDSIFLDDKDSNMALAPFLDMLNHSTEAESDASFNSDNNCYEITTLKTYKKHEQVFISYGPHDNHKLFLEYGFILPNNPNSVFEFTPDDILELAKSNSVVHLHQKWEILKENKILSELTCSMEGISWNLGNVFKILVMTWQELQSWKQLVLGSQTSENMERESRNLAHKLINKHLHISHQMLLNHQTCINYQETICKSLVEEDICILQTSIKYIT